MKCHAERCGKGRPDAFPPEIVRIGVPVAGPVLLSEWALALGGIRSGLKVISQIPFAKRHERMGPPLCDEAFNFTKKDTI